MIGHLTIGVTKPIKPSAGFGQQLQPVLPVCIVEINILPAIPTRSYVVQAAG